MLYLTISHYKSTTRMALAAPRYSIQQGHGRRASRREEAARDAAEAQPLRRTGAEIRPRLSVEYHKALGEAGEGGWSFVG